MHRVHQKQGNNNAYVTPSNQLLNLDDDSKQIIKERLLTAFGRQSKSFELEIEDDGVDSCFNLIRSLHQADDAQFVHISIEIAELLADSQRQQSIPGGFLLVVHCIYDEKPLFVLIKAEPHNALGVTEMDVHSIKDIILSPEQKLYKAVYYEQKVLAQQNDNLSKDNFRVVLFDSIINTNRSIAQYFYKNFLGLTISSNAELQTSSFYKKMEDQIWGKLDGIQAFNASDLLRAEILNSAKVSVNPHEVITNIIPAESRDDFLSVISQFPQSFVKKTSLIDTALGKKSIILNNVKITAPTNYFNSNVNVEEQGDEYVVKIRHSHE